MPYEDDKDEVREEATEEAVEAQMPHGDDSEEEKGTKEDEEAVRKKG